MFKLTDSACQCCLLRIPLPTVWTCKTLMKKLILKKNKQNDDKEACTFTKLEKSGLWSTRTFANSYLVNSYFLAHLSRRLIGELIVYPWSGVRRRPSSVRRPSVVRPSSTILKHLLLRNRLADQSQILCGASLGSGNEILFAASGSHDQDGRHAHI